MRGTRVRIGILLGLAMATVVRAQDVNPTLPDIPARTFNLKDFGGNGDGKTFNTDAFHKTITAVDQAGGGQLIVPAGVYLTNQIVLCSKLDLHLESGAIIQAPATFTEAGLPEPETFQNQADLTRSAKPQPLIYGQDLHDVAITGDGIIDGAGAHYWAHSERAARAHAGQLVYPRPKLVVIRKCDRLHVAGITLQNSPQFHLVPYNTTDLVIDHIKILAPNDAPNTDAIDPAACTNVLIKDCDLDVGDDDVAIKGSGLVEHVLIEDCRIKHGHGISIGSETVGGVRDMLVRRCTFDQTDNGIRIKSMRGAGGIVENIRYENIQMQNVGNTIVLDLLYTDSNRPNFRGDPTRIPVIKNIRIDHLKSENSKNAGKIVGLPDSPISEITLNDVQITAEKDLIVKDAGNIVRIDVSVKVGK